MAIPDEVKRLFVEYGRQGGKKRARRLTKAARKESARRAAAARWKDHVPKTKAKKKAKT
jgi:hypothetical protein